MGQNAFECAVVNGFDKLPLSNGEYRRFRTEILTQCEDDWRPRWGHESPACKFSVSRNQIRAFRHHVAWHATKWLETGRYPAQYVHRALGLDASFTLGLSRRDRWLRRAMYFRQPHNVMRLAQPWLAMAKTYEGREFIFRLRVPRPFASRDIHFNRTLDYGLRRWGCFSSAVTMDDLTWIPFNWISAAQDLGLDDDRTIVAWVPRPCRPSAGTLMRILIRLGAVVDLADGEWIKRWYSPPAYLPDELFDEVRLSKVVCILREHNVTREAIVRAICTLPHHFLDPTGLTRTLSLLRERGIENISLLLDGLGTTLANVKLERWTFLLDRLGVSDAETILQFQTVLQTAEPLSSELAVGLLEHDASIADLVQCQKLLLAAGKVQDSLAPRTALSVLTGTPYSLSLDHVSQATSYLCKRGDLAAFLAVLTQNGFSSPDEVLCFQKCYGEVSVDSMTRLLTLARPLQQGDSAAEVVAWVEYGGQSGYIDAYEYLARALKVRTLCQLRQVARLGFLGLGILRNLIEEQGLNTKTRLMDWFYKRAFGIKSLRWWATELDPVDKLLFEDAFARRGFNFLDSNRQCISQAVDARIGVRLGAFPYKGSAEEQQCYRAAQGQASAEERATLIPLLPHMLQATSGILLAGTVASAWDGPDALKEQLAGLAPLLDDLLGGRGPVTPSLTALEEDAIALIYRTAPYTIRSSWSEVMNRQGDIADWGHAASYPMKWSSASRTLQEPLDKDGHAALSMAAGLAVVFGKHWATDMVGACEQLRRDSTPDSSDLLSLAPPLGVLLAIAAGEPLVDVWLGDVHRLAEARDENDYELVLRMQTFFNVGLADALQTRQDAFRHALSNRAAGLLARALSEQPDPSRPVDAELGEVLVLATNRVRDRFGSWAARELAKFGTDADADDCAALNAVVTKHPGAFFAKEAVKLCTSANVRMWQEPRHAHLVVFDPAHKSLQAMALLYREILPSLHATRPVLVIRAINATGDAMDSYHVSSIVDAFLSTAVQIARDTGCVALAFPPNTGMHLLSNLDPIAADIGERYLAGARGLGRSLVLDEREAFMRPAQKAHAVFEAYERGQQPVDSLYVVWKARVGGDLATEG